MSDNSKSKRGGARPGAGRKKGSSIYGESTKAIRVPESMISEVKAMLALRIKFAHQNLILKPSHPGPLQQERGIKTRNEHKQQFESMDSDSPGSTHLLNSLNSADSFSAADLSTLSFPPESLSHLSIPLFTGKVAAGFPSPADDYIEKTLDLNDLLIQKPAATFFVRAEGESMLGAGIHPNDILVVDRSLEPVVGKIVICALNGELTVKRLKSIGSKIVLGAENPDYPDIVVPEDIDLVVWGVVTNVIHAV